MPTTLTNPDDDDDDLLTPLVPIRAAATMSVAEVIRAVPGYDEFEIDIEKVLRADLPTHFASIAAADLTAANLALVPERAKGAYMLFMNGMPVYAGKTDTRHGFRDRLSRHYDTVRHRRDLDPARIAFKAVRILVFSNFDAEAILIAETRRATAGSLRWNDTGFGSNDPGHRREGEESSRFDLEHPIEIDLPLDPALNPPGPANLRDALVLLKKGLPYTLRYETDLKPNGRPSSYRVGHVDQRAATIQIPAGPLTTRDMLRLALDALPPEWMATLFPDRVILYKEPTVWPYGLERLIRK